MSLKGENRSAPEVKCDLRGGEYDGSLREVAILVNRSRRQAAATDVNIARLTCLHKTEEIIAAVRVA